MNPNDFRNLEAGQVVRARKGYWTFIPAPLPPELNWTSEMLSALPEAERELSKLTTLAGSFPFPRLLVQPFMFREAVLSSRIEGMRASLVDLYTYEFVQSSYLEANRDVQEVHKYVRALDYGLERLGSLPVGLRLIRKLHAKLLEYVRGGKLTPRVCMQTLETKGKWRQWLA